jgi:tripartite-type tricarboxylate transporter receptor subunit TctC
MGAVLALQPAFAQAPSAYPSKTIRILCPSGVGGATDTMSRRIAERLSKALNTPVVVENQPGGSGISAASSVARAAPDGYTLLIGTITTQAMPGIFFKTLPYDPIADFEPISQLGIAALVLSLNNEVPGKTVPEFIAYAKANPGKLNYGGGTGSARLASEMLKAKAGVDIQAVPYKSNAQALLDLRGGQIQVLLGDIPLMLPQIRSGVVRGLAVSSARRSSTMPELPTLNEAGITGYELAGFISLLAPAKTPGPIIRRLNEEVGRILKDKEFADGLVAIGMDAWYTSPSEMREWLISENQKWRALAKSSGMQLD